MHRLASRSICLEKNAYSTPNVLFVTHDQEEALKVSDRVMLMNRGRIEQIGTSEEVYEHPYEHPATPFVYGFLGSVNLFHGRAHDGVMRFGNVALDVPEHSEPKTRRRWHSCVRTRSRSGALRRAIPAFWRGSPAR
jgi:ABC-type sulfate/molybdate transport systems ATPase subunit